MESLELIPIADNLLSRFVTDINYVEIYKRAKDDDNAVFQIDVESLFTLYNSWLSSYSADEAFSQTMRCVHRFEKELNQLVHLHAKNGLTLIPHLRIDGQVPKYGGNAWVVGLRATRSIYSRNTVVSDVAVAHAQNLVNPSEHIRPDFVIPITAKKKLKEQLSLLPPQSNE